MEQTIYEIPSEFIRKEKLAGIKFTIGTII